MKKRKKGCRGHGTHLLLELEAPLHHLVPGLRGCLQLLQDRLDVRVEGRWAEFRPRVAVGAEDSRGALPQHQLLDGLHDHLLHALLHVHDGLDVLCEGNTIFKRADTNEVSVSKFHPTAHCLSPSTLLLNGCQVYRNIGRVEHE